MLFKKVKNMFILDSRRLFFFLKLFFTIITLNILFRYLDFNLLLINLKIIPFWSIITVIFLSLIQLLIASLRFQLILEDSRHIRSFSKILQINLIASFYSQTMISFIGGDGVKIWLLTKLGISVKDSTHNVFIDRFSGLLTQLLAMILTFPYLMPLIRNSDKFGPLIIISFVSLFAIFSIFFYHKFHSQIPINLKILDQINELSRVMIYLSHKTGLIFKVTLLSALIILINILIVYVFFIAEKVEIEIQYVFLLAPVVFFMSMLPISFAGWGVREMIMSSAFSLIGIPSEKSIAVSVEFGITLLLISLPGSLLALLPTNKKT